MHVLVCPWQSHCFSDSGMEEGRLVGRLENELVDRRCEVIIDVVVVWGAKHGVVVSRKRRSHVTGRQDQ